MKNIIMILTLTATFMVSINCAGWKQVNSKDKTTVTEEKLPRMYVQSNPADTLIEPIKTPVVIAEEIKPDIERLKNLNEEISKLESKKEERTVKAEIYKIDSSYHKELMSKINSIVFTIERKKRDYNSTSMEISNSILEYVGLPNKFELPNPE